MEANFHVLSIQGPELRTREHRKRRHHSKNKDGCSACKQRRVKCDGQQPVCLRCARNGRACVYEDSKSTPGPSSKRPAGDARHGSSSGQRSASSSPGSLSIVQPSAASFAAVVGESNMAAMNPWIRENGTSVGHLLHHFSNHSAAIVGKPMKAEFWDTASKHTFLMSTMLAVSACHLKHFTPDPAPHRIAELAQETAAVTSLKTALTLPLHKELADALLSTAIILNAVNFAFVESPTVTTSWVFSDSPDRLDWLDLLLRFQKLQEATMHFCEDGILLAPEEEPPDPCGPGPAPEEDVNMDGIPAAWQMLVGDRETPNHRLYREPVRMLATLKDLEPTCINSFAYFGVVMKMEKGFRDLLFDKDARALWIFGYWLGLLGRVRIWWCSRRVERDWSACQAFLEEKQLAHQPGLEGRMWQVLSFDLSMASEWPSPPSEDIV